LARTVIRFDVMRASIPFRASLALCLVLAACGPRGKPAETPKQLPPVPLVELLPPGPSPLLMARPHELFQHEEARALWTTLVEPADERAFIERTGVDPRQLQELWVFEVGKGGYLLLARGPIDAKAVVLRAAERLAMRDVAVDEPVLRREGLTGAARYAYAAIDPQTILVAKNAAPVLVAAVLARRTDRSAPRALGGEEVDALYRRHGDAPCALFAPRPLELKPGSGAALLLAEERTLAATARPRPGAFHIDIELRGDFPDGAERNFSALVASVAQSPLGQLLGLAGAERSLEVKRASGAVQMAFDWPAQRLALGLRTLFMDDLRTLTR
jgi:hypothetical protein